MFSFGNGGPAKTGTMATSASSAASWGLCLCSPFGKVPPSSSPRRQKGCYWPEEGAVLLRYYVVALQLVGSQSYPEFQYPRGAARDGWLSGWLWQ